MTLKFHYLKLTLFNYLQYELTLTPVSVHAFTTHTCVQMCHLDIRKIDQMMVWCHLQHPSIIHPGETQSGWLV